MIAPGVPQQEKEEMPVTRVAPLSSASHMGIYRRAMHGRSHRCQEAGEQLALRFGERFEFGSSRRTWRRADGVVMVLEKGPHSIDEAWPWFTFGLWEVYARPLV